MSLNELDGSDSSAAAPPIEPATANADSRISRLFWPASSRR